MLEFIFIVLCILGLFDVVGVKTVCIVGLVYAGLKILLEILREREAKKKQRKFFE